MMKKLLIAAAVASTLAGAPSLSSAGVSVGIGINIAPPAPRVIVAPPPRAGWVWVGGFWDWRGGRHVWVEGRWVRERPNMIYVQPTWVQREGHWELERGGWHPRGDRDHDGVPNAADNHPNNPNRP
jgi:hypothetical protein